MPVTAISAIPAALQAEVGLFQTIFGGKKERRAERDIENLQTPTYSGNKSLADYYNAAMSAYSPNALQSQEFKYAENKAQSVLGAGISAFSKRGVQSGASRLVSLTNDSLQRAAIGATREQDARLGQWGSAAGMKAGDDRYGFEINKLMPYQKKLQLLGMKAQGGANQQNAGMQNIFGGIGGLSSIAGDYFGNLTPPQGQSMPAYGQSNQFNPSQPYIY